MKFPAAVGELKLQVRVDRMDAVNGGRVIIDYKTGDGEGEGPGTVPGPTNRSCRSSRFGRVDNLKGVLLARVRCGQSRNSSAGWKIAA